MTPAALIMMVVAILLIWGGLIAALVHLRSHPEEPDTPETAAPPESTPTS